MTASDSTYGGSSCRRSALVGAVATLAFLVLLATASPAAAVPFDGAFSPLVIGERVDLNGDGIVDGRDDANAFYGDTHIIDGMLDCDAWGATPNHGGVGSLAITPADDCILIGYDGTPDGVTIVVSGGEFQVPNGRLPAIFNATDPDDPDIGNSDFAWSAIGGRVDSNGDEAITGDDCHFGLIGETVDAGLGDPTDGADVLGNPGANECGFSQPPAGARNGYVDLNSDTLITAADSCAACFFGLALDGGLVQAPGPETLTLDPPDAANVAGTDHTVTARITDEFGNPLAGLAVHFAVAGDGAPTPAGGDGTTDANGEAALTFTNETAGANVVTACLDADADQTCDAGELSDTATKAWTAGPPAELTLSPESATNPVDADHVLTATVVDEFGNPVEAADVHFDVTGDGTPAPDSGDAATDAAGQAAFTFTNDEEGDNTITACADDDGDQTCDAGEPSDTATKTWEVPVPTTIELTPADDSNRVGTSHLVTAHVEDQFGSPWPGVTVRFSVTGANPTSGSGTTNATGDATFSYMGASAGDDLISAFADVDGDMTADPGEPADTAEKTWTRACPGFANDPRNQVVGTSGADVLNGTAGADIICGLGAKDVLIGRGGNDLVLGGAGADVARGGAGRDNVQGGGGRDRLFGDGGNDLLLGGPGPDRLDGGRGNDRCVGGPGRDRTIRC